MGTDTSAPSRYTRTNPFPAKLVVNRSLCGEGSEKDTRHFKLDLKGWGLNCGDARRTAKDVDAALRKIIQEQGGKPKSKQTSTSKSLKATSATSAMYLKSPL
jgi:sulfite reductase alpha subunit-like flavoprotein